MAIQKGSLSSVEHDWYATRSGMSADAPLNEHKAAYYASKGFGSNASVFKPVSQMETEWLSSLTGVNGDHNPPDQWREAVAGAGFTATASIDENKATYFANKTGNP
jgi:hypothetical protein